MVQSGPQSWGGSLIEFKGLTFQRSTHQLADPFTPLHHLQITNAIKTAQRVIKEKTGQDIPVEKYQQRV